MTPLRIKSLPRIYNWIFLIKNFYRIKKLHPEISNQFTYKANRSVSMLLSREAVFGKHFHVRSRKRICITFEYRCDNQYNITVDHNVNCVLGNNSPCVLLSPIITSNQSILTRVIGFM